MQMFVGTAIASGPLPVAAPAMPSTTTTDPVFAAIEEYERAYVECRAACAESRRLYERAIQMAGKSEVTIPDLRGPDAPAEHWAEPVAFERDGQKYVIADSYSFIDAYLPGDENKHLRQSFVKRLDEITAAQNATYECDPDEIVEGPAAAEWDAVDDLINTVPTTLPGLLALLSCVARLHERDPEMLDDQHIDPLVTLLGKAASALS
jgi:hypothetical protein